MLDLQYAGSGGCEFIRGGDCNIECTGSGGLRARRRHRGAGLEADGLWPSVVLSELANALVAEPARWPKLRAILDRRLAPWLDELAACPLCDLLARLPRDETDLDIVALAALLWSLVQRRQPALVAVLARVVHEAERLILAAAGRRACHRTEARELPAAS